MKSRFWLPTFVLGASLFLISCSSDDSSGTAPNMETDPFGDNGVFLNVLPPGSADANDRNIATDPNSTNQLVMYSPWSFFQYWSEASLRSRQPFMIASLGAS